MSLEVKIAETGEERELCYRLRYEVFKGYGYADENRFPGKKIQDEYDSISTIFLAKEEDDVVGTLRITPPSERGFEMEHMFDLTELKKRCKNLWESSKVMVSSKKNFRVLIGLMGIMYSFMKEQDITDICYMTHVKHEKMYNKAGIYRFIDEIKVHPEVNEPSVALLWNLENTKEPYLSMFEKEIRNIRL